MKKAVFGYGLISALICSVFLALTCLFYRDQGFKYGMLLGFTGMTLAMLVMYPAMVYYRDKAGGGHISYGRGVSIGLLITLITCICYSITWMIILNTVFPDFPDRYMTYELQRMKDAGETIDKMNAKAAEMNQMKDIYKNPVLLFFVTLLEPTPPGILISLLAPLIARRKTNN